MQQFLDATEAFETLYMDILQGGEDYSSTKALFNQSFYLVDPANMVVTTEDRKFKSDYAEYEWQWYLTGNRDAAEIASKAKIWNNMMVPGTTEVNSNYGYFWNMNGQLDRMVEELKTNPTTRRALLVHYDLHELDRYKYDTPCNVVLNFYVKDDSLHLTVFARSIDLVYGFCNDQYTFSRLMQLVSERTGIKVGHMYWHVTNLHIYPKHYDLLKQDNDNN